MEQQTAPLVARNGDTKRSLRVSTGAEVEPAASPSGSPQVRFQVGSAQPAGRAKRDRRRTASSSSHLSDSSSPGDESVTLERHAPDGGWGWVVVAAAFTVNMIADGVCFSFGIFFVEFLRYFGTSKSTTAWLGSIFLSLPLLLGPVASSLVDRFGCRKSTIAGSVLSAAGFILSYFAWSMELLFITFSIMPGIGLSLCYVSAVVTVAYYFERRRALATGISVCGTGVGTFLFPPLVEHLLQEYGWRGALLILSGIFLNMVVCGMLMRDLDWTKHKNRERSSQCTLSGDGDSDSVVADSDSLPDIERLRNALNSGDVVALLGRPVSREQLERLHSSALQLPTWLTDQDVSPEVRKKIEADRRVHDLVSRLYPDLLLEGAVDRGQVRSPLPAATVAPPLPVGETGLRTDMVVVSSEREGRTVNGVSRNENVMKSEDRLVPRPPAVGPDPSAIYTRSAADSSASGGGDRRPCGRCGARPDSTGDDDAPPPPLCLCPRSAVPMGKMEATLLPSHGQNHSCDSLPAGRCGAGTEARDSRSVPHHHQHHHQQQHQPRLVQPHHHHQLLPLFSCEPEPSAAYLRNMKLRRQSMTYRGAMLNIHRYRLRASSCPDIYRNSMITIVSEDEDQGCGSCVRDVLGTLRKMVDPSYFRLPGFVLFALSNFVLYMVYDSPYVYLADHAIAGGVSDENASMLISVIGISNVIGVLLIGYVGDRPRLSSTALYVACMLACGVAILLVPSCRSYSALVAVAAVFGFSISANYTLAPTILVDLISIENFTNAYGLLLLAQGLANLVGPPFCGMLHDLTSTYELTFRVAGAAVVASGLLLCLAHVARAARASRRALLRVTSAEKTASPPL